MLGVRTLVWCRGKDLRISDHAPLRSAAEGGEIIPLFVLDPYFFAPERARELPHRIQFLLQSLVALRDNIGAKGSRLIVVAGKSTEVVPRLATKWKVDRVVAQRWTEPFARERDRRITEALDVPFDLFEGELLRPPGTLRTGGGTPYAVFTPFMRNLLDSTPIDSALPAPRSLPALPADLEKVEETKIPAVEDLGLTPNPAILKGGERAARKRLKDFLADAAAHYHSDRDRMDLARTSRLSADLKFGTLSPRTVWHAVQSELGRTQAARVFGSELIWREFYYHTLWDRPSILEKPVREKFAGFPWEFDQELWDAWVEGRTGYPVVDAASRQLLGEGFVHNRARMIHASFLTKHLMIPYRYGEAHYMKYLTDGDWASNNGGWQWSAGCGCDAQPYFRVFNPITQGQKFDPSGDYVKRWVPELADMPVKQIHWPHDAGLLRGDYPAPVVEHKAAREHFLATAKAYFDRE